MGKTLRGSSRSKSNKKRSKEYRDKRKRLDIETNDKQKVGHLLSGRSSPNKHSL